MEMNAKTILNICGGKIDPIEFPETDITLYKNVKLLLNLDKMYFDHVPINEIIDSHSLIEDNPEEELDYTTKYTCDIDVYEFLERYNIPFDGISIYRFLEHVPKVKLLYFIYLLSTTIKIGGIIDCIVPDYKKLANMILTEDVYAKEFEELDIITTFELLNEPSCPHASIWTIDRVFYFFELEKRFKVIQIRENYDFDGRSIYLRFLAERVK